MKSIFLTVLFFFSTVCLLFSQDGQFPRSQQGKGTIYGKVIGPEEMDGLEFANVLLFPAGSRNFVQSFTTKQGGRFIFRNLAFGPYRIEINYVGLEKLVLDDLVVDSKKNVINLKTIQLEPDIQEITQVTVTSERGAEEYALGKKRFNINQNINNTGESAVEVLRNIPSLNVDIDGNVQFRGSSNVSIQINGRPASKSGIAGNLASLPAGSIEAIEVISNPGANQDAAGKSGIINIILKKPRNLGFNYRLNFLAGTGDKWNAGLFMNYRLRKWNFWTGIQFDRKKHDTFLQLNRKNILTDSVFYLAETGGGDRLKSALLPSFGIDWNPTKKVSVFASVTANIAEVLHDEKYDYEFLNEEKLYDSHSQRNSSEDEKKNALQAELGFDKKFARKGMKLKGLWSLETAALNETNDIDEVSTGHGNPNLDTLLQIYKRDNNSASNRGQLDFIYPVTTQLKVESGVALTTRLIKSDYSVSDFVNGQWVTKPDFSGNYDYDEWVSAAYLMATQSMRKWEFNAGLRMENTAFTLKAGQYDTKNNYTNFFPSGSIAYSVLPKGRGKLMLSYSKRISRPSIRRLNPEVKYSDAQNLRRGNPNLKPELTDSWELGWMTQAKRWSLSPAVFYRFTKDKIGYYAHLLPNGTRELTFVNLNNSTSAGAEVNFSYFPSKKIRFNTNVSFFRIEKDGENLENATSNEGNMLMSRLMFSYKPTRRLNTQITGFFHSGFVGTVGYSDPMKDMDFALNYSVFNNRGRIIFKVSDIFNTRQFGFHVRTVDINMDFVRKRESRIFWLGFNWELKQDHKSRRKQKRPSGGGEMEF